MAFYLTNGRSVQAVHLGHMPHQVFVSRDGEDWAGITNQKERRRLQNRLNQRARRSKTSRRDDAKAELPEHSSSEKSPENAAKVHNVAQKRALLMWREAQALESYAQGRLASDHLLHVIQLNVFNGMLSNASLLRLEVELLICTAISPFGRMGPDRPDAPAVSVPPCPANLAPTALQLQVPHHPWVDLFPLPRMRDNFLVALDGQLSDEDDEELWSNLMESEPGGGAEWNGLILWGAPWDPRSWEATLPFLRRWGCLVDGCPELIESTNYWRRLRGEDCLQFPNVKAAHEGSRIQEIQEGANGSLHRTCTL